MAVPARDVQAVLPAVAAALIAPAASKLGRSSSLARILLLS
jgi:hypothetical protein